MAKKKNKAPASEWIEFTETSRPEKKFQECIVSVEGEPESRFAKWYGNGFYSVYTNEKIKGVTHYMEKPKPAE